MTCAPARAVPHGGILGLLPYTVVWPSNPRNVSENPLAALDRIIMTRPEDLIYTVDEMPPWPRLLVLGMQHAMLLSVNLVLIVIVFRRAGAGDAATLSALSLGMIALAISSVLQSMRKGPVGSGYLAPPVFSAIYIGAAVLAAGTGGLPAVFGMTMFAGLVEIGLAPLLRKLRALFPPAISGFIVVIVGLQLGVIGIGELLGVEHIHRPAFPYHLMVSGLTLATMCGLSVWGRGIARLICSLLGVVVGMVASVAAGLVPADSMRSFADAPIFAIPQPHYLAYDFQFRLIPAFLMAGTAAMLRTVGVITTCQKINDLDWKRPELKSIQGGIVADGIGCIIGGLMGVIGMNSAVGPVGVAKATGATSRYIAYPCAAILFMLAFIPKYPALFLIMPQPVIGSLMVFTASFMLAGGIQIILSRSIDSRATYVVGVSVLLGLSREIFPGYFARAVPLVHQFTGSMMQNQLFEAALGIGKPWYVRGVDFDAARKVLTIAIDFVAGSRFAAPGIEGRHRVHDPDQAAAAPQLLPARMLPRGQNPAGQAARRAVRPDRARLVRQALRLHPAVRGAGAGYGPADDLCRGRQAGRRILAPRACDLFTLCRSRRGRG